ncbi:MAG: hypothetical protein QNK40_01455 [Desulfobacterales bacterium]|nr:hypothetical protein [Desulfobacterales bacterium]
MAFVTQEPGFEFSQGDSLQYCKKGLADYKIPQKIIITADVPRSLIGKIANIELRTSIDKYQD